MSAELVHKIDRDVTTALALLGEQSARFAEHAEQDRQNYKECNERLCGLEKWQAKLSGQIALFIGVPMWITATAAVVAAIVTVATFLRH